MEKQGNHSCSRILRLSSSRLARGHSASARWCVCFCLGSWQAWTGLGHRRCRARTESTAGNASREEHSVIEAFEAGGKGRGSNTSLGFLFRPRGDGVCPSRPTPTLQPTTAFDDAKGSMEGGRRGSLSALSRPIRDG
ncbi:uncharacterized protein LY79DRAFT_332415 [Colletotrichum navitas]|uniref:Uncharacterized protein n=1 Tax=Colletotrichum navitas TaxID=681940 RepID=A0AAD8PSP6_9PEZI|nr:uncharacterized protein LY79DRAFT_332415 [Colletotrichum navitas]KAK1579881.1 hypothetical protein LY79DRAFT_332415 [Colletotrichum navitas]